jgi:hypothetical protein
MNTRTDIINELEQLQSPLAAQPPVNVFTVPQGYFEGLAASVLRAVQGDNILQTLQPPANAHVPAGYFDNLAGNILNKIKAQENEDEPLSPLLESLRKTNVFTVPQGYFEELSEGIVAGQSTADISLSTTLESLRQQQVFTVPQGYFEALPAQIAAKLQQPKGKVVGFVRSRFVKYAAAAVVTGIMALGVYQFTKNGTTSGVQGDEALAALTDVQKQGIALSKNQALYNQEMEQLSDEAIAKFLTANGDDLETAVAAAGVNESDLPSEDDLMLDDAALEDFLNGSDKSNTN